MEQMTIDGATIAWSDTGDGRAHAADPRGGVRRVVPPVAPHVPGRVIRVLRAGYADGPPPTALVTIAEHAAHAAALLDALGTGPATVVGHSSGTLIVLELAAARPDLVRRLVLCEPPLLDPLIDPADVADVHAHGRGGDRRGDGGDRAGRPRGGVRRVHGRGLRTGAPRGRGRRSSATTAWPGRSANPSSSSPTRRPRQAAGPRSTRARIAVPTLLVAGSESPGATHRLVARLAGLLPHAEVATIEGANHLLPLTHPREVADLVTSGRVVAAG